MSERIGSVGEIPKINDNYEAFEFNRDTKDRIVVYGIDGQQKKTRLKEDDALVLLGHDPAAWQLANEDWEAWENGGRQAYLKERGLPYATAETLSLRKENSQLKTELQNLRSQNQQLKQLKQQLQTQAGTVANLYKSLETLQQEVSELRSQNQSAGLPEAGEDRVVVAEDTVKPEPSFEPLPPPAKGDSVTIIQPAGEGGAAVIEKDWVIATDPYQKDGQLFVTLEQVRQGQTVRQEVPVEAVQRWRQEQAEIESRQQVANQAKEANRGGRLAVLRDRLKAGWYGGATRIITYRNGEVVEERREGSNLLVGMGAVLGALAVAGFAYWLGTKAGGNGGVDALNVDIDNLRSDLNELNTELTDQHQELASEHDALANLLEQHETAASRRVAELNQQIDNLQNELAASQARGPGPEAGAYGPGLESLNDYGDTIWDHVEKNLREQLGYQPSEEQVRQATQRVLELNGLSWHDARHLPVGYDFKLPPKL